MDKYYELGHVSFILAADMSWFANDVIPAIYDAMEADGEWSNDIE